MRYPVRFDLFLSIKYLYFLNSGVRIQESEFRSQNSGVRIQESEFRSQNSLKRSLQVSSYPRRIWNNL